MIHVKIFVITGSHHKNGTSVKLAEQFIRGAKMAGHNVEKFDAAFADLHPCLGCDKCMMSGPCVQKDDMNEVLSKLISSDMVVFATPLYYFGMSAQLKMLIDRFYSKNGEIQAKHMKSVLLATCWDTDEAIMSGLKQHYHLLCDYLNWNSIGEIYGFGCGNVPMLDRTTYPNKAYELGLSIK